ncbi:NAD(P)-dependent oxidoreductase [Aureimonas jatrophae]|uniref:dihydrouracil dehydrogenase (NAD(+)) n=1 Tax=Aureimonas jatrophae TaxID=1166073 RepID=A0A1H0JCS2_9HYPH|nr:NAD(P)-dependent oxidoreductase [Aureimonas jatrophae]MBB3951470.1 glutamate synthase (NADPH/NADH) small chain [Aureimonas jatrophae]SDO41548.1 glutamate synthase (NADPH/NADH) small chain [Aureimonas jatrophae]
MQQQLGPDIAHGRLEAADIASGFSDLHPPLEAHEALVEADRCYFCFDAPCMQACPTSIDVPLFIRQIQTGTPLAAGRTILDSNILGGMCARVCPTETLCEEACVREAAEGKPVKIGMLQRFATDRVLETGDHPFDRAPETGCRVAVVGAGPAGLSCAHRLAMLGHDVTLFDARPKAGGLNEYGIAAYKATNGFAQAEVDFVLGIGGIRLETGKVLGRDIHLADLRADFDAVFLGIGLSGVNALGAEGEAAAGSHDAVAWIADLRQTVDLAQLPVGRRVVVVGGGMTAVDAAVQAKALGAEDVTLVYRRGRAAMNASRYEQELAQTRGVHIRCNLAPRRILAENGHVTGIELERTREEGGSLRYTGETLVIEADQVFKAIGQQLVADGLSNETDGLALDGGRIRVDGERRTSLSRVWAGGDCVTGGSDLTVVAVEDGKVAALSIDTALRAAAIPAGLAGRLLDAATPLHAPER